MDTETTGLDVWLGHRAFAVVICDTKGRSLYVSLAEECHQLLLDQLVTDRVAPDYPGQGQEGAWALVSAADWRFSGDLPSPQGGWTLEAVRELIEGPRPKVLHNSKFDLRMLFWTYGWRVGGKIHDTMILARIMLPSKRGLGLKILGDEVLQMPAHEEMEIHEWFKANKRQFIKDHGREPCYMDVPYSIMSKYAVGDVHRTMLLLRRWWISMHDKRKEIYDLEMELLFELMRMEDIGMRIDIEYTQEVFVDTERRIAELDAQIWETVGTQFNVNSDKQCAKYLLGPDGLDLRRAVPADVWNDHDRIMRTTGGGLSVARDALKVYRDYDPSGTCERLMLRNMLVGMDRYYKHFLNEHHLNSKGHYIVRPSILQHTATTGRFSVVEPALQTIPSRTSGRLLDFERDAIPDVRRCFVPTYPSWPMYAWDYSQIELRLIAFYAHEEAMIEAYATGQDVHDMTTYSVWEGREDLTDPVVFKRCRTFCKMVNFGLAYGMTAEKFHQELNTPMPIVERVVKEYHEKFPGISGLMDAVKDKVRDDGYLHNVFGRLLLPSRAKAYAGVNYLIQSTGADIMKRAIVKARRWANANGVRMVQIMTIHDEILNQIHPADDCHEVRLGLKHAMEDFPEFAPLPIVVGCQRLAGSWSQKEEVDFGQAT